MPTPNDSNNQSNPRHPHEFTPGVIDETFKTKSMHPMPKTHYPVNEPPKPVKRPSLYDLTEEWEEIEELLLESEGELTKEISELLDHFNQDLHNKIDGYMKMIKTFDRRAEAIKAEEDRLAKKRKTQERAKQRLKDYLLFSLQRMGYDKIETDICTVRRHPSPPSVEVIDENRIPQKFILSTLTVPKEEVPANLNDYVHGTKLDKQTIKLALLGNENVPGTMLKYGEHLRIT